MSEQNHGALGMVAYVLLIIGGLNWGLDGIGILMGKNLNVIYLLLGSWPTVEAVAYILVGLSALYALLSFGKCCKK